MRSFRRVFIFLGLACAAGVAMAQSKGDPTRGEALAKTCDSCHGMPGRASLPLTPWLAGQPDDFLVIQMFLLREGLREVPQMAGKLKDVSDPDFMDIAAYYARQAPPRGIAGADPKLHARGAGLAKAMGCGSCHLDLSGQKQVPRLANQREVYLVAALKAYRDNKRTGSDTSMNGIMYQVTDSEIEALAHYLAHQ